ncbi:MAG: ribosome maturation factor RimM [Oceanococcaceae bacterium]
MLGRIRGAFGVHGWIRVESFTEPATNILDYAPWHVHTPAGVRSFVPREGRWHGPGLIVQLGTEDGGIIADRDVALSLVNAEVTVPRSALPPAGPDEIYLNDLMGLRVLGADGHDFGTVRRLHDNTVQAVMEIGDEGLLVPFVRGPIVTHTDLDAGEIHLSWTADDAL